MTEELRGQILGKMPVGYALHKIITNDEGFPCDYEYIDVNKAFEEATGLYAANIIGKAVTEILPNIKNDKFDWIKAYSEVALNGINLDFEQYSGGLNKWYKVAAFSPIKGYFVTLISDITQEKESSKSLADSNKLLSDFLDSSSDMIFLKDDTFRLVFANKALCSYMGKHRDDLIGKSDSDFYPAAIAENFNSADHNVIKEGSRIISEDTILDKTFETVKFPVSYPNGTSGIGAFIKDITDRKRQEENLKKQIYRQNILVDVFMKNFSSKQELLDYTLHRALELTGSQYGYIYLYNEELREFTLNSWTIGVMADCEVYDKKETYKLELTGIWGEVVRQRKPIVENDMAQSNVLRKGFPEGHIKLKNFLSVPIMLDDEIVAVAGLGNKDTAYTDSDVNEVIILMQSTWLAVEKKSAQIQTLTQREKYQSILNELPALICEFLPDCTLTFANKEYCSYFDMPLESISERKFLDFVPESARAAAMQWHLSLTPYSRTNDYEFKVVVGGESRWHKWRNIGIFDEQGQPLKYYSIGFDITGQKVSFEEKERLLAQMDAMFNEHEAVMLLIDPIDGKILDANPSASVFYGYSRNELLELHIDDINQLSHEEIAVCRSNILHKKQKHFTFPHKLKNGQVRMVDVYSSPISYNSRTALFSIVFDVTQREEAFEEIVYISYHDYLTGAYNRRFFEEEYNRLNTESNFPISVVMGDVNGLKLINDSFGHHQGDKLLIEAVTQIAGCLDADNILARIGGDEFGIIIPKTNVAETNLTVKKIKRQIEMGPENLTPENNLLSISFGFAIQENIADGLGKLMKEAEGYLYSKKFYDSRSLKGKTINIIMKTLFEKSPRDKTHSERVGNISAAIAEMLGFDTEHVNKIRVAGFLHDIGKIGIPESLLNKKGKLDQAEWEIMKSHPEKSRRILENTIEYSEISNIVLYHHEKWDGSGYPSGLKGEEIPLESRIIAAADAYDAMTYNRSYRKKISPAAAIEELKRCAGAHFDPKIVEVFVEKVLADEKDFFSNKSSMSDWYGNF